MKKNIKVRKKEKHTYLDRKKNLHILGRKDNTIKISGYRVDTLEVENLVNTNFNFNNTTRMLFIILSYHTFASISYC